MPGTPMFGGSIERSPDLPSMFPMPDCASSPREHRLAWRSLGGREGAKDSNPQGWYGMARIWDVKPG